MVCCIFRSLGKPNVRNVEDVVKAGEEITVYVLKVEKDTGRIALSLVKPPAMPWDDIKEGSTVTGTVVRLEKFGVFVDIGAERPGMIHVSELASGYVNSPSDVVKVGDEVKAQVIKVNRKKRRIDLSLKALEQARSRSRRRLPLPPTKRKKNISRRRWNWRCAARWKPTVRPMLRRRRPPRASVTAAATSVSASASRWKTSSSARCAIIAANRLNRHN